MQDVYEGSCLLYVWLHNPAKISIYWNYVYRNVCAYACNIHYIRKSASSWTCCKHCCMVCLLLYPAWNAQLCILWITFILEGETDSMWQYIWQNTRHNWKGRTHHSMNKKKPHRSFPCFNAIIPAYIHLPPTSVFWASQFLCYYFDNKIEGKSLKWLFYKTFIRQ